MDETSLTPHHTPRVNIHQMAVAPRATKDAGFYPLPLLLWCVLALALYASWAFILPTRLWWNTVDTQVFFTLNTLATSSHAAQVFWAILSSRLIDIVPGIILLLVFWSYLKGDGGLFFAAVVPK